MPDFGFEDTLWFDQSKTGWNKFLDFIKNKPVDEKTNTAMKLMKGKKEIYEKIMQANNKELLLNNENILKGYIAEKSILPRLNSNGNTNRKASIFWTDTMSAMNSLINSWTFISEV